jgi:hypothetical protein
LSSSTVLLVRMVIQLLSIGLALGLLMAVRSGRWSRPRIGTRDVVAPAATIVVFLVCGGVATARSGETGVMGIAVFLSLAVAFAWLLWGAPAERP